MEKSLKGLSIALALASAIALGGCACSAAPSAADGTGITVSASSENKVVPDKAQISIAVRSQATTADSCQNANAQDVNAVIDALMAQGVAEENIQTEWTNLSPIQDFENSFAAIDDYETTPSVASPAVAIEDETSTDIEADQPAIESEIASDDSDALAGGAEYSNIVGYEMYTSLSVKGLEIDDVSAVTAAAIDAGATDVNGIQYYSSSYDEAYAAALQDAIDQARDKAQAIADGAGVRLGSVIAITEGYQNTGYRYADNVFMESAAGDAGDALAKTMPGEIDIIAQVTVRFAIA